MPVPLIHIGYHKSGTTWFQRYLFDNPQVGFGAPKNIKVVERIVMPGAFAYSPADARRYVQEKLQTVSPSLIPVISHERISGSPHSGGFDSKQNADRIRGLFDECRVLISVREQRQMIYSCYSQYVKVGGATTLKSYINPIMDGKIPLFHRDYFRYHHLVQYYRGLFGENNVLVLPYELFRDEPRAFVSRILEFAHTQPVPDLTAIDLPFDIVVNKSSPNLGVRTQRMLNALVGERTSLNQHSLWPGRSKARRSRLQLIDRGAGRLPRSWNDAAARRMKTYIQAQVAGYYKESNAILGGIMQIDLGKYGYEL